MTDQELLNAIRTIVREEVKAETTPIKLQMENEVIPAIQMLAEGHENIIEHIDEKIADRTEKLEYRIEALEAVVKQNCYDIRQLKKAQ